MKEMVDISLSEAEVLKQQPHTIWVDVREPWEFEEFNVGGVNIPLADIRDRRDELLPYDTIIAVCTNGTRSKVAAKDYCRAESLTHKTIYHVKGGLLEFED
jgi:rhodanese-related sulfurtransferase